jgi:hypothetical protein
MALAARARLSPGIRLEGAGFPPFELPDILGDDSAPDERGRYPELGLSMARDELPPEGADADLDSPAIHLLS